MYRFLAVLALLFQCVYGTPVCTAISYSGVVYETDGVFHPTNTVYTYSYTLNVTVNNGNASYPNILTISNFAESLANGYIRVSDLKFIIETSTSNETLTCGTNCVLASQNGFAASTLDLNYLTVFDDTNIYVQNGGIFHGDNAQMINQGVCLTGNSDIIVSANYYLYNQSACCIQYTDIATTAPPPPSTDTTGTSCGTDASLAWLDVVYVIDVSSGMPSIQDIISAIASIMKSVTVGQIGDHSTRVGIVTFLSTTVTTVTELSDTTNFVDLVNILGSIKANADDFGGNIAGGLKQAYRLIRAQRSYRKPVIVLAAATYDPDGVQNINNTVAQIKQDGIELVIINYAAVDGILTQTLQSLASDGFYYVSNRTDLISAVSNGFTQINCFCTDKTLQLSIYNTTLSTYTRYADCFRAVSAPSYPSIAEIIDCPPGWLIHLTDTRQLDFITDNYFITNKTLNGVKKFNTGLHKNTHDNNWYWWGFNGTEIPAPAPSGAQPSDTFGYMVNTRGFTWALQPGSDTTNPYICQTRACDVANVCK
jgi:hypothetical protein